MTYVEVLGWIAFRDHQQSHAAVIWEFDLRLAGAVTSANQISDYILDRCSPSRWLPEFPFDNPLDMLAAALCTGHVMALGINSESNRRVAIPEIEWTDLYIGNHPHGQFAASVHALPRNHSDDGEPAQFYRDLRFDRSSVLKAFPATQKLDPLGAPPSLKMLANDPKYQALAFQRLQPNGSPTLRQIATALAEIGRDLGMENPNRASILAAQRKHKSDQRSKKPLSKSTRNAS